MSSGRWDAVLRLGIIFKVPLLIALSVVGFGMVVVVADAPLLVLGLLLIGFSLFGRLKVEHPVARITCTILIVIGVALASYSGWKDGNAVVAKLRLIPEKVGLIGPSSQHLEQLEDERRAEAEAQHEAVMIMTEMHGLRGKYPDLPNQFPELLGKAHALAERAKELQSSGFVDSTNDLTLMLYKQIKADASHYRSMHDDHEVYRKVFGSEKVEREK